MNFITPARLASAAGVATGLAAAATALAGFFTTGSSIGNAIVAAAGVLGTVATIAKFLDGQAGWEQQAAQHAQDLKALAVQHYDAKVVVTGAKPVVVPRTQLQAVPEEDLVVAPAAELPDETPIEGTGVDGTADVLVHPETGEPTRLHDQATG